MNKYKLKNESTVIQINGKCEVPIQIISQRLLQMMFFELSKTFFTDGQTYVQIE